VRLLFSGLVAFAASLALTPLVREGVRRWGLVDQPDQIRKVHATPVPRLGGVAIILSYVFALAVLGPVSYGGEFQFSWLAIAAIAIVFATGFLDDLIGLKPWLKLGGQVTAALIAFLSGIQIHAVQNYHLPAWASLLLTVAWLIACCNAFNIIDGMDGLAAGVGFVAAGTMFIAALIHRNVALAMMTLPLCGALLGFLRYNFNPASIFMGDCGSLSIGFLLGCFGVLWTDKSATALSMTAPVLALAVPLLDAGVSIVRRLLRNQPVFRADRRHMHHRLLDRGLTTRQSVMFLYGGCALAAILSLLANGLRDEFGGLVIVLFCALAFVAIQYLGYVEFGAATRFVISGRLRKVVDAEVRLNLLEENLARAATLDEYWTAVCGSYHDFGFEGAKLSAQGRVLERLPSSLNQRWQVRIPLCGGDYINFYSAFTHENGLRMMPAFIAVVENALKTKLGMLEEPAMVPAKGPQAAVARVAARAASGIG